MKYENICNKCNRSFKTEAGLNIHISAKKHYVTDSPSKEEFYPAFSCSCGRTYYLQEPKLTEIVFDKNSSTL